MKPCHVPSEVLYAYQDGQLPAAERQAVEAHLAICARCQSRLAQSLAVRVALKAKLGPVHAPESLRMAVHDQINTVQSDERLGSSQSLRLWVISGVGVGLMLIIMAAFILGSLAQTDQRFLNQLARSHASFVLNPDSKQIAGEADALSAWFSQSLKQPMTVPMSDRRHVLRGRMDVIDRNPVAHILYDEDDRTTVSFLVWRGARPLDGLAWRDYEGNSFYMGNLGSATIVLWLEGDLIYACIGRDKPEQLLDMAAHLWRQMQGARSRTS